MRRITADGNGWQTHQDKYRQKEQVGVICYFDFDFDSYFIFLGIICTQIGRWRINRCNYRFAVNCRYSSSSIIV